MRAREIVSPTGELYRVIAAVNYMTVQLRELHRSAAFKDLKRAKRQHDVAVKRFVDLARPFPITTGTGRITVEQKRSERKQSLSDDAE